MKTQILNEKWTLLKEYDFIVPLSEGDGVNFKNLEYVVKDIFLDMDNDILQIIVY